MTAPHTLIKIPMLNLPRQQEILGEPFLAEVSSVLTEAQYLPRISTPEPASAFEVKLARLCGRRFALGVASGTSALHLALLAVGVRPGDEVIIPANTFVATAEAIIHARAVPVFVDVDPFDHLLTLACVRSAITAQTGAIVPVHLYGNVADVDALRAMLTAIGRENIRIVEDCAHAVGASRSGKPVPLGGTGAFSFNPGKNLGGIGDAGAVVTDSPDVADRVRLLSNHGRSGSTHALVGFNSRLSTLNDRILALKIDRLSSWNARRRVIAKHYDSALTDLDDATLISTRRDVEHARHQYVIQVRGRSEFRARLSAAGIETRIHYHRLVPHYEAFQGLPSSNGQWPVAEEVNREIVSLPCYAELTEGETEYVIAHARAALIDAAWSKIPGS